MKSHRVWMAPIAIALSALTTSTAARGDLILSAEPLVLTADGPGSTGRITINIASDTGTDVLDSFGVEFRLTTSNGRYISFVNPPTDTQLGDASYIFNGDSVAEIDGPPSGIVSTVTNPGDTYIGGDGTLSGQGVTVPLANPVSPKLLLQLDVTALTGSPPQAGDIFYLTLVTGPFTFFDGPIPEAGGLPPSLAVRFNDVPIRIVPSTVPEPSSITAACVGMLFVGAGALRRQVAISRPEQAR